ncbi:hypothetical protein BGZ72_010318 [Mortierella alpina]|nr:hypothetical protein BGZ72_010318 [Mortierella alpina]
MAQKDDLIFEHHAQDEDMDENMDEDMEEDMDDMQGGEEEQQDNGSSGIGSAVNDHDMAVTWTTLNEAHPSMHSHTDLLLEDNYASDGSLPELCIALDDPDGGHIEELLYWLYTDDGPRWKASFNETDYESILQNIRHLNIVSPVVLRICKDFEASVAEAGVKGLADKVLS